MTLKLNNIIQEKPTYTILAYLYACIFISWSFSDVFLTTDSLCKIQGVWKQFEHAHTYTEYEMTEGSAQER